MTTPYWLYGLPFDIITLDQLRSRIFAAADSREQLIFATSNTSFLAQADRDPRFRDDILHAKLNVPDGMPVVWLGRVMGVPFAARVTGSDLLASLISVPGPRPLRVFFFGGEEGAAEAALHAVNRHSSGVFAVGAHYPGFVSVEQMSSDAVIGKINQSGADLLIVATGAAKGHRWIEANRGRIETPVISYLGAAINFAAGRLRRAPYLLQRGGLEWLWRIKEEPALFKRYARDGWHMAKLIARFAAGEAAAQLSRRRGRGTLNIRSAPNGTIEASVAHCFGAHEVQVMCQSISHQVRDDNAVMRLTMTNVTRLDAISLGWLYAVRFRNGEGSRIALVCDAASRTTMRRWRADVLVNGEHD